MWENVEVDVERGILDAQEDGDPYEEAETALSAFSAAVDSAALSPNDVATWSALEPFAYRGIEDRIDDGELVDLTAESLRERVRQFGRAMQSMALFWYTEQ